MREKPFPTFVPRCVHCGRAKNQHRARTLECPEGPRTPTGYLRFAVERFVEAKRELQEKSGEIFKRR